MKIHHILDKIDYLLYHIIQKQNSGGIAPQPFSSGMPEKVSYYAIG